MTAHHTTALMQKAYQRWAPVYDIVYDKLTEPAARAAVAAVEACGPRILEVGVGTGLSLGSRQPHQSSGTVPGTRLESRRGFTCGLQQRRRLRRSRCLQRQQRKDLVGK